MALFVSGINEFCNLVKIQAELLSASSCIDKSVSCRLAALTSIGIAEIKLNDASMGLFPTTAMCQWRIWVESAQRTASLRTVGR